MDTDRTGLLSEHQVDTLDLEDMVQRGIAASSAGDKEGAHQIFQDAASRYPDAPEVWVWIGWTSPSLDDAQAAFERAHTLDAANEEATLGLRWVESQRASGTADAPAGAAENQAEVDNPDESTFVGSSFDNTDTKTDTNLTSTPALELPIWIESDQPKPTWTLEEGMQVGIAAVEVGDKTGANHTFRQMADLYPDVPEVWVWLAATSSDLAAAEAAFERAHTLDPRNMEANLGLRWAQLRRQAEQGTAEVAPDGGTQTRPAFRPYDTGGLSSAGAKATRARGGVIGALDARFQKWNIPTGLGMALTAISLLWLVVAVLLLFTWVFGPH